LEREYRRLLMKRIFSAAIPQPQIEQGTNDALLGLPPIGRLQARLSETLREIMLATYSYPLRHIRAIVTSATASGAHDVLVVARSTSILRSIVSRMPGIRAYVTPEEAKSGNLCRAFDQEMKFDLCIWHLGLDDLIN